MSKASAFPYLGFGLGLRAQHYTSILAEKPNVDWFEIITENYLIPGGKPLYFLDKIRDLYPMTMHGVSLSIGSSDPLDQQYLKQVKSLINRVQPAWISDHLCWTGIQGFNTHDLLPIPYTEEAIKHIVTRIQQVQEYFGRQILIENVSSYITYKQSEMPEWEFLTTIAEQADCLILLDVNNVYVSAFNHGFDPCHYINAIPVERVKQFHLAGHSQMENYIIDTHDTDVAPQVWALYALACKRFGSVSVMIERDDKIPSLQMLTTELQQARIISCTMTDEVFA